MSSTVSPVETSSSSPSSTSQPNYHGVPSSKSAPSLYLYAFLATLLVLLVASMIIVSRYYVIRRRTQLRIEEAMRNGTYVAPVPYHLRRDLPKPVLHDMFLAPDDGEVWDNGKGSWWKEVTPIAASIVPKVEPITSPPTIPAPPRTFLGFSLPPPIPEHAGLYAPPRSPPKPSDELDMVYLVRMPTKSLGDATLPMVEFGVMRGASLAEPLSAANTSVAA
ncbi:hypothetical protein EIP91_002476 [Steccherinum ochraceum]|uniref:Uncharacterized protein n=1 Tax=Steccherinum ochraceum TaxID=92696 RepID=A0A4R0RC76_9APHY|nr:hypothetical protein EIP91_002476 [Steccherinum ochraceum]